MSTPSRGRPPASSREVLADAACELFLEQGYEATSVTEITRRAGVSRSSFFNYFPGGKSETLWFVLDRRIEALLAALRDPEVVLERALLDFGIGDSPDTLALAIANDRIMGVEGELASGRAARQLRIGLAIADRFERCGSKRIQAEIVGAAYAGALIASVWRWAELGAGRHSFASVLGEALDAAHRVLVEGVSGTA